MYLYIPCPLVRSYISLDSGILYPGGIFPGISLVFLVYPLNISGISLEYLSGIFLVYLLNISSIFLAYLWYISGNYIISCTVLCPWRKI